MKKTLYFILVLFSFASVLTLQAQREKFTIEELEFIEKNWSDLQRTNTGIFYKILKTGNGSKPRRGDQVSVFYKGTLLNGIVFDQNSDPYNPFKFRIGNREVISAWDECIPTMQVGEKRLLIIPAELAYGTRGNPPRIPRNASLIFEVELIAITPLSQLIPDVGK